MTRSASSRFRKYRRSLVVATSLVAALPVVPGRASSPAPSSALTIDHSAYAAATGYMADPHLLVVPGGRVFGFFQRGGASGNLMMTWSDNALAATPAWAPAAEVDGNPSAHAAATLSADSSAIYAVFARTSTTTGIGRDFSFRRITNLSASSPSIGSEQFIERSATSNAFTLPLIASDSTDRIWSVVRVNTNGSMINRIYSAPGGVPAPPWSRVLDVGTPSTNAKSWPLALRHAGSRTIFVYADRDAPTSGTYMVTHDDSAAVSAWSAPRLVTTDLPTSAAWDGASAITADGNTLFVGMDSTNSRFGIYRYSVVSDTWTSFGTVLGQDAALGTTAGRLALVIRNNGTLNLRDSPLDVPNWTASRQLGDPAVDIKTARQPSLVSTSSWWLPVMWSVDNAPNVQVRFQVQAVEPPADTTAPVMGTLASPSNVGQASFDLAWSPATDANGIARYRVDIATDSGFASFAQGYQDLDVGNVLTRSITGLASGTAYWARVRAVDTSGNVSTDSNVVTATTSAPDTSPPGSPIMSSPGGITGTSVDVSWCCATDDVAVSGYRLDAATDPGFSSYVSGYQDRAIGNVTSQTVSGLSPSTPYWFRVRAVDAAANASINSNAVSATTADTVTVTLSPVADAYVEEANATANHGSDPSLLARFDPQGASYLRFDGGAYAGWGVVSAHLRLTVDGGSTAGGTISDVADTSWIESTMTWSNRPAIDDQVMALQGSVVPGDVADFDVADVFDPGPGASLPGLFTLGLRSGASDDVVYRSREASSGGPQLVLQLSPGPPVPAPVHIVRGPYVQDVVGDHAIIAWTTARPSAGTVAFGSGALDRTASDPTGTVHAVQLTALAAGTSYSYQIMSGTQALTPVFTFSSAAGPRGSFTFTAFGDSGTGSPDQYAIASRLNATAADLNLHLGDVVYPSSDRLSWDPYFFQPYATWMRSRPNFGTYGNHESGTEGGQPYIDYSYLPTNTVDGSERYYSFDEGDAHFVSLDTELSLAVGSAEYVWLDNDLATSTKPWKIVFMHKPVYSSSTVHPGDPLLQQSLAPLLTKYSVSLVLAGHAHDYERTVPIGGVTYIVSGGGGGELYALNPDANTAFGASVYNFLRVSVTNLTITTQAILEDGSIADTWTVSRDVTPPAPGTTGPATPISTSGFTENWSAATDDVGVVGYRLDVASDPGFTTFVPGYQNVDVGNALSYQVTGLNPNSAYYVRIRAVDKAGNISADSNTDAVTTATPQGDTSPPVIGVLASGPVTDTTWVLTWSAATDDVGVAKYLLDVATDAGFATPVSGYIGRDVGSGLTMTVTSLSSGVGYWARIRATDAAGNVSSYSGVVMATTFYVWDAFSRTVSGGWGSAGTLSWLPDTPSDFSVDGAEGSIRETATGSRTATLSTNRRDVSVLMRFRFARLPTSSWNGFYALARTTGANQWYSLRVRSVAGASDDVEFDKDSSASGLVKVGSGATVPEIAANTWMWLRFEAVGDGVTTTLRGRIWADGTTEPTTWKITTTDTQSVLQNAAGVGVRCTSNTTSQPAWCDVDDVSARSAQ